MQGWVSIHRKLMNNPVWQNPNYLKLWIYCLFKASHAKHEMLVGNRIVHLERGQFITGRRALAAEMNAGMKESQTLSGATWERYLKNLEKWQMLSIKVNSNFSVITIVNYDFYQQSGTKVDQQYEQHLYNNGSTNDQQMITNNNGFNVNKKNEYQVSESYRASRSFNVTGYSSKETNNDALINYGRKHGITSGGKHDETK
jgi:hypothetical protein